MSQQSITVTGDSAGEIADAVYAKIGSGKITTISPVAQSGEIETYRGDSYLNADGRMISWSCVDGSWPDLTGASILVVVGGDAQFSGSVVMPTGSSKQVGLELTSAQSLEIPEGIFNFVVRATTASGSVITLVSDDWTSRKQLVLGS